ncbi:MAG: relaxase/mobilization nuclease domain-containing protein, partial [Rudanella sp.]|nr:relaxase/mobilization nuclease domain-containing protein [Rudanella sp.]
MIVRLNTGKNVTGALQYNEQKLQFGDATILSATNFSFPSSQHNRIQRSLELNRLAGKNHRVQQPGIHFALSYHPSEKPTDEQMRQVAADFMEKLGYADQPYVVYRHNDRPHPHLHIVSVKVDRHGKRISDSHIKLRCNTARKELEIQYRLVKAEEQNQSLPPIQSLSTGSPADQPVELANGDIKRAIGSVVRTAFTNYSFSSFEDFDGFLNQYGIQMNRQKGKGDQLEGVGKWRGITFQLVAADKAVTPRIKASSYSFAPTADRLENRFRGGAARKQQQRGALLHTIKKTLAPYATLSEDDYKRLLREAGVQVVAQGDRYLYIDHNRRAVYGDAELGAGFMRKQLLNRFGTSQIHTTPTHLESTTEKKETKPSLNSKTSPSATEASKPSIDPPQPNPLQREAPEKLITPHSGTTRSDSDWGKLLSKYYQQHRQQSGVYFESQLIEAFPHGPLRTQMVAAGHPADQVSRALIAFETYKQGCLPEIRAKEQAYFNQTANALLSLAIQMPIDGPSRLSFLKAAQLNVGQEPTGEY